MGGILEAGRMVDLAMPGPMAKSEQLGSSCSWEKVENDNRADHVHAVSLAQSPPGPPIMCALISCPSDHTHLPCSRWLGFFVLC